MAWTDAAGILENYEEVLKTFYLPAIQEQLNNDTILASILERNEDDVSGKNATIELHYGRSTGRGVRNDAEALPEPGVQKHKTMIVPMQRVYGRIAVTGPTIAATRDDRGAYIRALDSEITGIVKDLQKEVNRMYWGCGYGILAKWNSGVATEIVLQKAYTGSGGCSGTNNEGGFGSTFGAKYFKEEQIDGVLATVSNQDNASTCDVEVGTTNINVSAISEGSETDTITVTDPGTPVAGSFFLRPKAANSPFSTADPIRKEIMGLRGIITNENLDDIAVKDGTNPTGGQNNYSDPLQGLDVDEYSFWKAHVDTHASGRYKGQRSLTFTLMQKMFDKVEESAGKDYGPDLILTTRAIRREYLELCQADRRIVNTLEMKGGWTAIDYNGVPFTVDNDAIDGEIYFITSKDLAIYQMSDYAWMQKDGAVLSRISGYDAYEAVLYRYAELGCRRRNSQGVLCDLDYDD